MAFSATDNSVLFVYQLLESQIGVLPGIFANRFASAAGLVLSRWCSLAHHKSAIQ